MGKETYKQRQNKHKVTRPLFNAFDSFCSKMMQKDVCFHIQLDWTEWMGCFNSGAAAQKLIGVNLEWA